MKSNIGLIGIGVMGSNIALNLSDNQYKISILNKSREKLNTLINSDLNNNISGHESIQEFIDSLEPPKKVLMLIPSGDPTFNLAIELISYLSPGDTLIDGGNAYFLDSEKLGNLCKEKNINFIGMGVSGGESGARHGPSLMIGARTDIDKQLLDMLVDISAKYQEKPCIGLYKGYGTGHFIKMLHNGIEYAEMQIIAEIYRILKNGKLDNIQISNFFDNLKKENKSSYLIEITAKILLSKNEKGFLIDQIQSKANHKGTGKLSVFTSMENGFPLPSIYEAFNSRVESHFQNIWPELIASNNCTIDIAQVSSAMYFSRMCSMLQGLLFIENYSQSENLNIEIKNVLDNWSAGCIIRSDLLHDLKKVLNKESLAKSKQIQKILNLNLPMVKKQITNSVESNIAIPVIISTYNWYINSSNEFNPSALIQAQRDYFGGHKVQLNNSDDFLHLDWD